MNRKSGWFFIRSYDNGNSIGYVCNSVYNKKSRSGGVRYLPAHFVNTAYLIIFDLGVGNSVIRYMAKFRANNDRESQRKFLGVTTVYYAAVTLVILIVGVLLITVFPNVFSKGLTSSEIVKAKELLSITIVTSAISIGTSAFSNTLVAYERFAAHKGIMILANIAKMAVLVFLMKAGVKSVGVVTVNLIVTAATRLFYICYVFSS